MLIWYQDAVTGFRSLYLAMNGKQRGSVDSLFIYEVSAPHQEKEFIKKAEISAAEETVHSSIHCSILVYESIHLQDAAIHFAALPGPPPAESDSDTEDQASRSTPFPFRLWCQGLDG